MNPNTGFELSDIQMKTIEKAATYLKTIGEFADRVNASYPTLSNYSFLA